MTIGRNRYKETSIAGPVKEGLNFSDNVIFDIRLETLVEVNYKR